VGGHIIYDSDFLNVITLSVLESTVKSNKSSGLITSFTSTPMYLSFGMFIFSWFLFDLRLAA
jgi:hypothetical protein